MVERYLAGSLGSRHARWASRLVLFVVVAALGVFALGATSAFAAAPEVPQPHLNTRYSKELFFYAYLDPNAAGEAGTYKFLYKASTTGVCEGGSETTAGVALGEEDEIVRETIAGLAEGTTYAVCLVAEDKDGRAISAPLTVTTTIAVETPQALTPEPLADTTATLRGLLNPAAARESEPGRYEFRYRQSGSECEGGGESERRTPEVKALGHEKEAVESSIAGLAPATQYTFCLHARNEEVEAATSSAITFTTGPEGYVTEVSSDGAVLHAIVNPQGAATTYAFEYATAGGAFVPVSGGAGTIPAGIAPVSLSAPLHNLQVATPYQFRLTASGAAVGTVMTPPVAFTTQASDGEFKLPDNRAYELVSSPDRAGALLEAITHEGGVIESSESGSALTYVAKTPTLAKAEADPAYGYSQMMATRGEAGGWSSRDIATPRTETTGIRAGYLAEYYFFTPELMESVLVPKDEAELAPGETEDTIFIANGLEGAGGREYTPLVNARNTPPGTHYGRIPRTVSGSEQLLYAGASANLEHVVIYSKQPLTAGPAGFPGAGLYEWTKSAGGLQPVSILPGEQWANSPNLGYEGKQVQGAISSNGEIVFWTTAQGELFVRNMRTATTTLINPEGAGGEAVGAQFQYATPDGSKVYFTSIQRLTANSTAEAEGAELYEYDTLTGGATDLTPNPSPEGPGHESTDVRGEPLGISSDGEYVYFVANGALATGASPGDCETTGVIEVGECNLYVQRDDDGVRTTTLIAVLSGEDERDWAGDGGSYGTTPQLLNRTARVSPNGRYLTFMSDRSLTGYDNDDAASGVPDEEVYLYDADNGHLVCASCNPSGARPHGVFDTEHSGEGLGLLVDRPEGWHGRWLAGSIPGWTGYTERLADYQSRYLTDEGRLFFDSADGLVPQDTNGKEDVYEYEPEGVGPEGTKCGPESVSGSEAYEREGAPGDEAAGCVALISSGKSSEESAFLDASAKGPEGEEGENVFFLTDSQLTGQEVESGDDIYDAHICSSQSPCQSTAVVASPACTNEESCRAAPAPQPAIFGAPASATFSGAGNVTPAATTKVTTKKRTAAELKAEKLAKALKQCAKDKQKSKRKTCEASARKKYGAGKAKKTKKTKKSDRASNDRRGK
jgi:hypothetical protein